MGSHPKVACRREVDAIRHDQGRATLPGGGSVPSAGGERLFPQPDAARPQPPPQPAEKPPLPGHSRALRSSQAGITPSPLHGWLSPFKRAACGPVLEGGLPGHELQRSHSRPGATADSSSGGSQATRAGSMPGQMSGLTGSPGRWAGQAGQLPGAERQDSQLLPELDALLEADGCPELPGQGPPGPALALQHPLNGLLGVLLCDTAVPGAGRRALSRDTALLCCLCCVECTYACCAM